MTDNSVKWYGKATGGEGKAMFTGWHAAVETNFTTWPAECRDPQATCLQASDSNYATTEALAWRDDEGEGIIISLWKLMIHSSFADSRREIYGAKHCDLLSVQPIREWPGEPIKVPTRGLPSSLSRANTGELVPRRPVGTALSFCLLPRWIHSNNSCHGYQNYFLTSETPWSQTQSISYMSVFRLLVQLGFF